MATIVDQPEHNKYNIEVSCPESVWVSEMAEFLGMSKSAVVAAAFGHGITYYRAMCRGLRRQTDVHKEETQVDR